MDISKLVYGVGVNDADYPVTRYEYKDGSRTRVWVCPIYRKWCDMLGRCYSESIQKRQPSYIGCHVFSEWHLFSNFHSWMSSQEWQGLELDKDLLCEGNKIYHPDFCVFIPGEINNFLTDCRSSRGDYPIGVSICQDGKKFRSSCRNPFSMKREFLGVFSCPNDAHAAWRRCKHKHAEVFASMQTNPKLKML